eukprot:CAMPEP_0172615050 /NCGR_PEP_ID=MMETSP1068-20121228/55805_1 /TAXON_ID=35684 /ORGANISM="Pseudopedinella elastica, Strain CCMP716" /LENGTH=36 /DNA_ID= /DNA_START= /DNA_END= /DNA_ORIENTATION=
MTWAELGLLCELWGFVSPRNGNLPFDLKNNDFILFR